MTSVKLINHSSSTADWNSLFVFRFCVRPPPNSATPRSEYKVNKIFCFDKVAEKALYLMSERLTGPHPIRLGPHPAFAYL